MRLNQDLIRLILLEAEGEEPVDLAGYTDDQIDYHKYQLIRAELLAGNWHVVADRDIPLVNVFDLTWAGHEFLANARNATVWKRAKDEIARLGGSLSLKVLETLLTQIALQMLK